MRVPGQYDVDDNAEECGGGNQAEGEVFQCGSIILLVIYVMIEMKIT